jgi:tRNA modification GTPase
MVDATDAAALAAIESDLAGLPTQAPRTIVYNKIDRLDRSPAVDTGETAAVWLSAATGAGLDLLREHLKDCVGFHPADGGALSARTRHLDALRRARTHFDEARRLLVTRHAGELVAQELTDAQRALGEITGEVTTEELLGRIFGSFCIGK